MMNDEADVLDQVVEEAKMMYRLSPKKLHAITAVDLRVRTLSGSASS
jgi:hypothetical protein